MRIVCDNMIISGSAFRINESDIPVRVDQSTSFMHHKFIIIDKEVVLTGSYNWTASGAAYNRENVLLCDDQKVVTSYLGEFQKLWDMFEGNDKIPCNNEEVEVTRNRFVFRNWVEKKSNTRGS